MIKPNNWKPTPYDSIMWRDLSKPLNRKEAAALREESSDVLIRVFQCWTYTFQYDTSRDGTAPEAAARMIVEYLGEKEVYYGNGLRIVRYNKTLHFISWNDDKVLDAQNLISSSNGMYLITPGEWIDMLYELLPLAIVALDVRHQAEVEKTRQTLLEWIQAEPDDE